MDLTEIGKQVQIKRIEAGLLQEHLARLTGLSRVTINQLENGTLNDLGYAKLKIVLEILGIGLAARDVPAPSSALALAARSISTSYKDALTALELSEMLRSGVAPERYHAHLMALLDETPLPVVVRAVAEAATPKTPARKIMKHLAHWAKEWKVCRTVWQ